MEDKRKVTYELTLTQQQEDELRQQLDKLKIAYKRTGEVQATTHQQGSRTLPGTRRDPEPKDVHVRRLLSECECTLQVPALKKDQTYHVFISHSSEDDELADVFLEELEQYGFKCFQANRDFVGGQSLIASIEHGIMKSARVVMLVSRAFLRSQWSLFEAQEALTKGYDSNQGVLVPVLVDVTPEDVPEYMKLCHCIKYSEKEFWNKFLRGIIDDMPLTSRLPAGNVAHGLAWSYFYGFLNLVLPELAVRVKTSEFWNENPAEQKILSKMVIILPRTCYCPKALADIDTHLTHVGFIPYNATRAGNINRDYKSSVYKIRNPKTEEEYFFMAEFATPLLSLYEMEEGNIAGLNAAQKKHQRLRFEARLREILTSQNNQKCHNRYILIDFQDETSQDKDRFGDYLRDRIKNELEKEKKQALGQLETED